MKQHTSSSTDSGFKAARSKTGGRDAGSQLQFDFGALSAPTAGVAVPADERPEWRFALRFAAIMEAEPACTFANSAVSGLAREIFGMSAGRARDAYDSAEAGFSTVISQAVIIPMLSGKGKTLFQLPKHDRIRVARQYKQLAREIEHRVLNRDAYLAGELEELPLLAVAPVVVADELDAALAMR